jgi:hypothetical protein
MINYSTILNEACDDKIDELYYEFHNKMRYKIVDTLKDQMAGPLFTLIWLNLGETLTKELGF